MAPEPSGPAERSEPQPSRVFVIHGRNLEAREATFEFLRSAGLNPIEWNDAVSNVGEGSPVIGQVLANSLKDAQAVVAIFTPDDLGRTGIRYAFDRIQPQARQNVIFEAGMAFGFLPKRTILLKIGDLRLPSDMGGLLFVEMSNGTAHREALIKRLTNAGCQIVKGDWRTAGDFDSCRRSPDWPLWRTIPRLLVLVLLAVTGWASHRYWPDTVSFDGIVKQGKDKPGIPGIMVGVIGGEFATNTDQNGYYKITVPRTRLGSYTGIIVDFVGETTCTPRISQEIVDKGKFDYSIEECKREQRQREHREGQ